MKIEPAVIGQSNSEIRVLAVDDDVAWVELLEDKLRAADDSIATVTATSAGEAESVLRTAETSIDCVVCDYRMPGTDGLEFLSTVRDGFEEVPFILLTGAGSEDVASEAIAKGVSDYIVKDQVYDNVSILLNRVRRAVETARLRQEVGEKRELYETLLEQTSEGICITQDDEVVLVNDRLISFFGRDEASLVGSSFSELVAPVDPDSGGATQDPLREQTSDVRVSTPGAGDRVYELRRQAFQMDGTRSTLWSFRDVTAASQRKKQLRRERDLSRSIIEILAQSSAERTVEESFCKEVVTGYQFQFAWVGTPTQESHLAIQTHAGDGQEYLSEIAPVVRSDGGRETPPSLWALRSDEPQFLYEIPEYSETWWGEAADAQGFTSVAALPLVHEGISYGVFCLYSGGESALTADEEQFLQKLAGALARAISNKRKTAALTSEQVSEVSFRVTGDRFYLNDALRGSVARAYDAATVESVVQRSGGGVVEFVTVEDARPDEVTAAMAEHETVESVRLDSEPSPIRLQVETGEMTLGGRLQELGVRLNEIVVEDGVAEVTVQLPTERDEQAVLGRLREEFDIGSVTGYTTKSVQPRDGAVRPSGTADLTQKQQQAAEAALNAGYFERPRENSATEVAELLGVSHSTFLHHLRAAERKLFDDLFG